MDKLNFKSKLILYVTLINFFTLIISYGIFINIKLTANKKNINNNLVEMSKLVATDDVVIQSVGSGIINPNIDKKMDKYISIFKDIDIIVVADVTGKKYSHLDKKQIVLLNEIVSNDLEELVFDEREFPSFQKSVLRAIKDKLELDESVSDIIMEVKPEVKFYFDLNENDINCIPKFVYNNEEVSYFAEAGNVIRDIDYENEIVSILQDYGFHKLNNIYLLDDFDLMCEFVDTGLDEISAKYPVYTSEKIQNTNLIKNNSVTTQIGRAHV